MLSKVVHNYVKSKEVFNKGDLVLYKRTMELVEVVEQISRTQITIKIPKTTEAYATDFAYVGFTNAPNYLETFEDYTVDSIEITIGYEEIEKLPNRTIARLLYGKNLKNSPD